MNLYNKILNFVHIKLIQFIEKNDSTKNKFKPLTTIDLKNLYMKVVKG